jgi:hypothetical protein
MPLSGEAQEAGSTLVPPTQQAPPCTPHIRMGERAHAMIQNNQYQGRNKPTRQLAAWLARCVKAAGDSLFRENDALARRHGWHIEAGRTGLSRAYRDPRFDCLASCPQCHGRGSCPTGESCPGCLGTGRIELGTSGTELSPGRVELAQPPVPRRGEAR